MKVLVPVDGSPNALLAVRHVLAEHRRGGELEVHLLNVQPHLSRHISRFVSRTDRDSWHQDRARDAMAGARALLEKAGVPLQTHWSVGERAEQICETAQRLRVQRVVMGTARKNSITRMLEDSTTSKVLELTQVPVEVITGESISKWERWALPASVVGLGWLLFMELTSPH